MCQKLLPKRRLILADLRQLLNTDLRALPNKSLDQFISEYLLLVLAQVQCQFPQLRSTRLFMKN